MKKIYFFSLIILFLFILITAQGYLGSNVDICAYRRIPNTNFREIEIIGGRIATLTYRSIYLAPYVTSTLLFSSFFFLINKILKKLSLYRKNKILTSNQRELYSLIVATSSLLVWPFYPYLTNALRQGVALAFASLLVNLLLTEKFKFKNLILFFNIILLSLSHRTAIFFVFTLFFSYSQTFLFKNINFHINKKVVYLITSIFGAICIVFFTGLNDHGALHSPGIDLGLPLLIFSVLTILFLFLKVDFERSVFPIEIYNMTIFLSLVISLIYQNGFASERLFPYLLITSLPLILENLIFYFKQTIATIFILIILGFNITIFSGQYLNTYKISSYNGRWCSKLIN